MWKISIPIINSTKTGIDYLDLYFHDKKFPSKQQVINACKFLNARGDYPFYRKYKICANALSKISNYAWKIFRFKHYLSIKIKLFAINSNNNFKLVANQIETF